MITRETKCCLSAPIETKILVGWGSARKIVVNSGNHAGKKANCFCFKKI